MSIANIACIDALPIEGKRVFIRVDFNVPIEGGKVTDDTRIRAALPTIQHALGRGARVVLASHLGRPKGKKAGFSLEPAGARLAELLGAEVLLTDDCIGDGARKVVSDLREGKVALLENLRYHDAEEANDEAFARELARGIDVYCNDAFGAAHRAHASVDALPRLLPVRGAGFLMHAEVRALSRLLGPVERPYVAILGGAKVSDKIAILENLVSRVDALCIGGAMGNTFLRARGDEMGASLVEEDKLHIARNIMAKAQERGVQILLPTDLKVAMARDATDGQIVDAGKVTAGQLALDIGPASIASFRDRIVRAKIVFWNGPMGLFENPAFAEGTMGVARAAAECQGYTVVGGGDSVAAIQKAGLASRFGHVSTGGGASLELLEGRKLPGIEALRTEG
jgi:phosphoglycerate kinase